MDTMNKQKIYIISKFFFPNIGGVENSLRELACALSNEFDVVIFTTNINNVSDKELALCEKENGYNVIRIDCKHENKYIQEILFLLRAVNSLRKENKNCCIIARDHFSVIYSWLAGIRNIRYLVPGVVKYQNNSINHGAGKNSFLSKIESFIQVLSFKMAKKIFVFSNNMKKQVSDLDSRALSKISLCKPGVNFSKFYIPTLKEKNHIRDKYEISKDVFLVLGLARFVKAKGYSNLLLAFGLLPVDYQLILVGDGPERDCYDSILANNRISNVKIFGPTSKPDEFYKMADLFAMTSLYEPLGQTILESQATGLPNVYHRNNDRIVTASEEVVFKLYSFLINENTPESIAAAIIEAREGLSQYKASDMVDYIKGNYSWYKLGLKLINED
jgi:1,2-diacylglycerol 3-alpha-glucosyltransferase